MKINTNGWKEFSLKELGFVVHHGTRIKKADRIDGNTIFLTAGKENQGVAGTIGNDVEVWHNPITVDMFGNCFYHPYNCAGDDNIYAFVNDDVSSFAKTFIAAIINTKHGDTFAYINQFRQGDADVLAAPLPSTPAGEPDWDYMEQYIKRIELTARSNLAILKAKTALPRKRIDTSGWGNFRIGDLFEKVDLKFVPDRPFNKAFDVSQIKTQEFNLPLVNAKHDNNGIMYYGRKEEWEFAEMSIDIVQNGAISTGDVYAQPQATGVLWDAYLIKPKFRNVTENILLFLAATIQTSIKKHFNYDNKCIWDKAQNEVVRLPVKANQSSCLEPDWNYMDQYIEHIKKKTNNALLLQHTNS